MKGQLDRIETAQQRIEMQQQVLDAKLEALLSILAEDADDGPEDVLLGEVPRERSQYEPL